MQSLVKTDPTPSVFTLVKVDPDRLIELGHRLKQTAMDFARLDESVTVPLTDRIVLLFEPGEEFQKPYQTYGQQVTGATPAPIAAYSTVYENAGTVIAEEGGLV